MKMTRYLIFHLVRHTDALYAQTPEEEARSQREVNEFILSWYPRVQQFAGAHAMGMVEGWDWMGLFGADELGDWEAFHEDYRRRFPGRTERSLALPGISHEEFVRATDHMPHYKALRKMGVYPGGAERHSEVAKIHKAG